MLNPVRQPAQGAARAIAKPLEHQRPLRVVVDDHDRARHLASFPLRNGCMLIDTAQDRELSRSRSA